MCMTELAVLFSTFSSKIIPEIGKRYFDLSMRRHVASWKMAWMT